MPALGVADVIDASSWVVRVENHGTKPFRDACDNQQFVIPPGKQAVVPVAAAKLWFGDWTKRNKSSTERDRDSEVARLQVRLGVYEDGVCTEHGPRNRQEVRCKCEDIGPLPGAPLHVFDMEGQRIMTILDDPSGTSLEPVVSGDTEKERIMEIIRQQSAQLKMLQAQLGADAGLSLEDIDQDFDADDSTPLPPKRGRGRPRRTEAASPLPPVVGVD